MDAKQGFEATPSRPFSHIVIGQDDADEVIQAGVIEPVPAVEAAPAVPEPQEVEAPVEEAVEDVLPPADPEPVRQDRAKNDDFQETTLEDLQGESMPFAQKAVLIGAALLVVVAVVYWFFLR